MTTSNNAVRTWAELSTTSDYYTYDAKQYPFDEALRKLWLHFDGDLSQVHLAQHLFQAHLEQDHVSFNDNQQDNKLGKDQTSCFHRLFYQDKTTQFEEFQQLYLKFVRDCVLPIFSAEEDTEFAVQEMPTFRTQIPNTTALGQNNHFIKNQPESLAKEAIGWHCDSQYDHEEGEINFILPITRMFDTNTVFHETGPDTGKYLPITQDLGQFFHFYGNKCHHYNVKNQTDTTRISIDFRIIPMSRYNQETTKRSMTQNKAFKIGSYFVLLKR